METPFAGDSVMGSLVIGNDRIAIVVGTILVSLLLWAFEIFKMGAGHASLSQNQLRLLFGDTGQIGLLDGLGSWLRPFHALPGFARAGHFGQHAERVFGRQGIRRGRDRWFWSLPGALLGGLIIGLAEPFAAAYLPR